MARHRSHWWQTFGRRLSRAWQEFKLEGKYLKIEFPDEADGAGQPPAPPGEPPEQGGVDYDDLQRRVMARLRSWQLGNTVTATDAWTNNANWAMVQSNVESMHELDLRQILSMSREEFRASASRYEPFWYH